MDSCMIISSHFFLLFLPFILLIIFIDYFILIFSQNDLTQILEVIQTSISWFSTAQSSGQTQHLLNQILDHKQQVILFLNLSVFLKILFSSFFFSIYFCRINIVQPILICLVELLNFIFEDISYVGKSIHAILKEFYQVSYAARVIIIDKLLSNLQQNVDPIMPNNYAWLGTLKKKILFFLSIL